MLVIGAGGLGSPVALYLAGAGIGSLTIVDGDAVDLTNLQRQIGHDLAGVGNPKALSLAARIAAINPEVRVVALHERADAARLDALAADANIVVDCSDNFATRQAVNACVSAIGTAGRSSPARSINEMVERAGSRCLRHGRSASARRMLRH